jgi:hypothetical protein
MPRKDAPPRMVRKSQPAVALLLAACAAATPITIVTDEQMRMKVATAVRLMPRMSVGFMPGAGQFSPAKMRSSA